MAPANIAGTTIPNTEDGVKGFRQVILNQERGRVMRNEKRANGDFSHDLNAASRILEAIDATVTFDWEGIDERENRSLADRVSEAHEQVDNATAGKVSARRAPVEALAVLRDELAVYAATLANYVAGLDQVVNHIKQGELE